METATGGAAFGAAGLTEPELQAVNQVELTYPGVKVARDVSFEEIWALFLQSGFLYPEKVARMQPAMAEIQQTVRALLSANGRLLATIVLRNERLLESHISILRWCEQTWIVQHLAALPLSARGLDASARVNLALTYYGQLRPDIQWVKMFFRPNNPWPARVFGGFAQQLTGARTSDLRVFHYLVAPADSASLACPEGVRLRSAGEADWVKIAEWFRDRGRQVELAANDLEPSRATLPGTSRLFSTVGVQRQREAIIAERGERLIGFTLLEISSAGLNFSELTNAFTVYSCEEDRETRLALIGAAKRRYAELGRLQCIALEEGDVTPFEAAGFVNVKDYACWTFHRTHLADLEEYFIMLFTGRRRPRS